MDQTETGWEISSQEASEVLVEFVAGTDLLAEAITTKNPKTVEQAFRRLYSARNKVADWLRIDAGLEPYGAGEITPDA